MLHQIRSKWLSERRYPSVEALFSLPAAIYFLLKFRPDLLQFGCESEAERLELFCWWESDGYRSYPQLEWNLNGKELDFLKNILPEDFLKKFPSAVAYWLRGNWPSFMDSLGLVDREQLLLPSSSTFNTICPLPLILNLIYRGRPDLQRSFNISHSYSHLLLINWWFQHGKSEYPRIEWHLKAETLLQIFATLYLTEDQLGLPAFLIMIWEGRQDLQAAFDIGKEYGRLQLLNWWQEVGKGELSFIEWRLNSDPELLTFLTQLRFHSGQLGLPAFLVMIWEGRQDLQAAFDIGKEYGRLQLLNWWNKHGQSEYPAFSMLDSNLINSSGSNIKKIETSPNYSVLEEHVIEDSPCDGLNIIGFSQGVLGIGEDIRMAANALLWVGVPIAILDAPIPGPAKTDTTLNAWLVKDLKYRLSLFCLPPTEMLRLAIEGGAELIGNKTYNIGAWPWELPHLPPELIRVHEFVDEIWAQSRFVASVFKRITDKPIINMPMLVEIPAPTDCSRGTFALPEADFLFFLMFDGASWLSRKNPLAGVQAFLKAFPSEKKGVGLVIKAMNVTTSNPQWQSILTLAGNDSRIKIIDKVLIRQDAINLMACCDAYISLHRSEGFGRVIAEAMLLKKPTVVTNFSGNVDFCQDSTSYLVNGELIPLQKGDYLFYEGQYWCEPDVNLASEKMIEIFEDKLGREKIAKTAYQYINDHYSKDVVARAYSARLGQISNMIREA